MTTLHHPNLIPTQVKLTPTTIPKTYYTNLSTATSWNQGNTDENSIQPMLQHSSNNLKSPDTCSLLINSTNPSSESIQLPTTRRNIRMSQPYQVETLPTATNVKQNPNVHHQPLHVISYHWLCSSFIIYHTSTTTNIELEPNVSGKLLCDPFAFLTAMRVGTTDNITTPTHRKWQSLRLGSRYTEYG